jgi:hypothetical protein
MAEARHNTLESVIASDGLFDALSPAQVTDWMMCGFDFVPLD